MVFLANRAFDDMTVGLDCLISQVQIFVADLTRVHFEPVDARHINPAHRQRRRHIAPLLIATERETNEFDAEGTSNSQRLEKPEALSFERLRGSSAREVDEHSHSGGKKHRQVDARAFVLLDGCDSDNVVFIGRHALGENRTREAVDGFAQFANGYFVSVDKVTVLLAEVIDEYPLFELWLSEVADDLVVEEMVQNVLGFIETVNRVDDFAAFELHHAHDLADPGPNVPDAIPTGVTRLGEF